MGTCLVMRRKGSFKAWINVQANPNATITATGSKKTYTAVADATTGIASILIKKKDAYKITSDCGASYEAANNTTSVNVTKNKQTYTAQKVKLNAGYTSFAVRNDYGSNTLIAYWNGSMPSSYCTNYYVEEVASSGLIGKYTGTGTSYTINTSTTVNGYKETATSGTTKTYQLTAFITINGKNYHGNAMTASGTATKFSASKNFTATGTYTVPQGIRTMTVNCIGGGGGPSNKANTGYWLARTYEGGNYYGYLYGATGGGGGGSIVSKTISVIPGQSITYTIGSGGGLNSSGGTTSLTVNGVTCSASGGTTGGNATVTNAYGGKEIPNIGSISGGTTGGGSGTAGTGNNGTGGSTINGTAYGGGGGAGGGHSSDSYHGSYYQYAGGYGVNGGGNGYSAGAKYSGSSTGTAATGGTANSGGGSGSLRYNVSSTSITGGSGAIIASFS